jgi:hypothetical protein
MKLGHVIFMAMFIFLTVTLASCQKETTPAADTTSNRIP